MNDNKQEKKNKSVLQKVLLILECIVVAVCMVISILVILKPGGVNENGSAKTTFLPVQSDSMEPTIPTGALVFTKKAPGANEVLDLGTIITFVVYSNQNYLNTHRIVGYKYADEKTSEYKIEYYVKADNKEGEPKMENYEDFKAKHPNEEVVGYVTRGDKYTIKCGDETLSNFRLTKPGSSEDVTFYDDKSSVELDGVVAVYGSHVNGLGYALTWLMEPTHFFIVIMVPLICLFLYNVYEICRYIIGEKVKKQTATAALTSEEIARKAVEEYIAQQQKMAENAQSSQNTNNTENSENSENSENINNNESNVDNNDARTE